MYRGGCSSEILGVKSWCVIGVMGAVQNEKSGNQDRNCYIHLCTNKQWAFMNLLLSSQLYRIDSFLILEKVNSFHTYNTGEAHKNERIVKFTITL